MESSSIKLIGCLIKWLFFSNINKELVPETDESRFTVRFKTPLGSNIDYTYRKLLEIEDKINTEKQILPASFRQLV